ncbi:MAG: hypothetical protein KDJ73_03970 [Notoacmeibacter sp.]|nr:hypothetical protein [Notoacmeibacter sp.]
MNVILRILLTIAGIALLLPGVCSAGFMVMMLPDMNGSDALTLLALWGAGFAVAAGGFFLLRWTWRQP